MIGKLIDQGVSVDDDRRRESYWQNELDKFQPNGLNEREMALFKLNFIQHIPIHIVLG